MQSCNFVGVVAGFWDIMAIAVSPLEWGWLFFKRCDGFRDVRVEAFFEIFYDCFWRCGDL